MMNYDIKKHIDDAAFGFSLVGDTGIMGAVIYQSDLETYTELIIRECIDAITETTTDREWDSYNSDTACRIKDYFGITDDKGENT